MSLIFYKSKLLNFRSLFLNLITVKKPSPSEPIESDKNLSLQLEFLGSIGPKRFLNAGHDAQAQIEMLSKLDFCF